MLDNQERVVYVDLKAYLRILRRWLWFIILLAMLASGVNFIANRIQPPQYQASVTIQVGSAQYLQNPNTGLIQTSEQLADTYAVIVKKYPVLQATITKLQIKMPATELLRYFQVRVVPNTALLEITVTYPDAVMAADIANELGAELIASSPTDLALNQQGQIKTLQTEIADAQNVLDTARKDLSSVSAQINTSGNPVPVDLATRRNELISQINAAQANLAQLTTTLAALQKEGTANSLKFVENARIPEKPAGLPILSSTLITALAGAVIAFGLATLFEYLNDTIRSPAEMSAQVGIRQLGSVPPFGKRNVYTDKLITWLQPRSPVSEAYRMVRVGLIYAEKHKNASHRVYIVTSPSPGEGKTVTAANLAVMFSVTGMRVLLIDADIRRPNQHNIFGLNNVIGLSNALTSMGTRIQGAGLYNQVVKDALTGTQASREPQVIDPARKLSLLTSAVVQKTKVPGLDVITAGYSAANPAELLGAAQMQDFVEQLAASEDYDVVIFDTPPALTVSDSYTLANVANATVILVVEARKTRRGAAAHVIQEFAQLSIPIAGVVINRLNPRDVDNAYSYYYGYYGYGGSNNDSAPALKPDVQAVAVNTNDSPDLT